MIELDASASGGGVSSYVRVGGAGAPASGLWVGDETSLYYNGVAVGGGASGSSISADGASVVCSSDAPIPPTGDVVITSSATTGDGNIVLDASNGNTGDISLRTEAALINLDALGGAVRVNAAPALPDAPAAGTILLNADGAKVLIGGTDPSEPSTLFVGTDSLTYGGVPVGVLYSGTAVCSGVPAPGTAVLTYYIPVKTGLPLGISATASVVATVLSRFGGVAATVNIVAANGYVTTNNSYVRVVFSDTIADGQSITVSYAVFAKNTTTATAITVPVT